MNADIDEEEDVEEDEEEDEDIGKVRTYVSSSIDMHFVMPSCNLASETCLHRITIDDGPANHLALPQHFIPDHDQRVSKLKPS